MTSEITLDYEMVTTGTLPSASIVPEMMAAPVDYLRLEEYGLLLFSDETSSTTTTVTRGFVLKMLPATAAAATATIEEQSGIVTAIDVTAPGSLYAMPPVVTLSGQVVEADVPYDGIDDTVPYPASAVAVMAIGAGDYVIASPGANYFAPSGALVGGQLAPGGTPAAIAGITVVAGEITAVSVTPGGPYLAPPQVVITDVTGSGGEIVLGLHVASITLTAPGRGYETAPDVVITPLFKAIAPDGTDQASTMTGWMTGVIQAAIKSPVDESVVVS